MPDEAAVPSSTAPPLIRPRRIRRILLFLLLAGASYLGWSIYRSSTERRQIKVDYVDKYDEIMRQIPEADRAWPIYRDAILSISEADWKTYFDTFRVSSRDKAAFAESLRCRQQWLEAHKDFIVRIREVSARPHFGFVTDDAANQPWWDREKIDPNAIRLPNADFSDVLVLGCRGVNPVWHILYEDARRNAAIDDGDTMAADFKALLEIGRQIAPSGPSTHALVGFVVYRKSAEEICNAIAARPELFSDSAMARIAALLKVLSPHDDLARSIDFEKFCWEDSIQRLYTDDGHGDGKIAAEAVDIHGRYIDPMFIGVPDFGAEFLKPIAESMDQQAAFFRLNLSYAGRRETNTQLFEIYEKAIPYVRMSHSSRKTVAPPSSPTRSHKKSMFDGIGGSLDRMAEIADRVESELKAALVAVALEQFRRSTGAYPTSIDRLVPQFLDRVPIDPFDGKQVRYSIRDDKPFLYSVGYDGIDNGGQRPSKGETFSRNEPNTDFILLPVNDPDQHYAKP